MRYGCLDSFLPWKNGDTEANVMIGRDNEAMKHGHFRIGALSVGNVSKALWSDTMRNCKLILDISHLALHHLCP